MGERRSRRACVLAVAALVLHAVALGRAEESSGGLLDARRLEKFVDELPDMPRLRGYGVAEGGRLVAGNLTIGMYDTTWKFHRDLPPTRVFAYGTSKESATVPGPTIEAMQGVPTYVTWTNHLPARHFLPWDRTLAAASPRTGGVPTVVHLHGGVQHSTSDGHSLAWFTAGLASTGPHFSPPPYAYPNRQPPGNLWYHDHAMGLTRVNILAGLAGAYRVSSPAEEGPLRLPSGAAFDRNLVLFDRDFRAADGSLFMNATGNNPDVHPQWQPEYFGGVVCVNGKAWPFLRVARRRYRFRILNASNARFFRLALSAGLRFLHLASDSVYLPAPVDTGRFLLAPSEIADVVVDFAAATSNTAVLTDDAPAPYPGDNNVDTIAVMKFVIEEEGRRRSSSEHDDPSRVPARLMPQYPRPDPREASLTRRITMYEYTKNGTDEPTHLYLNARAYTDPVTETPAEGSTELWDVINLTDDNHPLHVHLAVFAVLEQRSLRGLDQFKDCMVRRNDAGACGMERHLAAGRRHDAPRQERGWKNVFKVRPGAVTRLLVRFKPLAESRFDFDVTTGPGYVYHCHVSVLPAPTSLLLNSATHRGRDSFLQILDHEDNEMMRPMKIVRSSIDKMQ
ncbi:hypothetical protein PR202_ga23628 [Eleusine coracana subsp. coracana]|uniref:Uncharacterized protein n=1 Tax=Eleusine coracana subsp. coracana TaxID=191504 RepID=A0AAV5D5N0_ELECO|nr:hypothetical protein PR202_ga23628 [Eleusine coracana subsp. coracana]